MAGITKTKMFLIFLFGVFTPRWVITIRKRLIRNLFWNFVKYCKKFLLTWMIWFSAWISWPMWVWLTACGRDLSQEYFLTQVKTWKWDKSLIIGSGALCIILWEGKMLDSLSCGLALSTAICERQFWGHGPHTQAAVHDGKGRHPKKQDFLGILPKCWPPPLPTFWEPLVPKAKKEVIVWQIWGVFWVILECFKGHFFKSRFWELGRP